MPKKMNKSVKQVKAVKKVQKIPSPQRVHYAPVAMSKSIQTRRGPQVQTLGNCTRITHSEWFTTVIALALGTFRVQQFSVNPGISTIFPWLSRVAQRYETYKFRKLQFEYHTICSSLTTGTFGMVFDFDANDAAPSDVIQALTYHDKYSSVPWDSGNLSCDLQQGDKPLSRYVRAGIPTTLTDLKTTDLGTLSVFTDTIGPVVGAVGRIEAKYVIDLYTPQIDNDVGGSWTGTTGLSNANLVGAQASWLGDEGSVAPFVWSSTNDLLFTQTFEGLVTIFITGTGLNGALVFARNGEGSLTNIGYVTTATSASATCSIKLAPGTLLSAGVAVGTTVSYTRWLFSSGTYSSFAT